MLSFVGDRKMDKSNKLEVFDINEWIFLSKEELDKKYGYVNWNAFLDRHCKEIREWLYGSD